VVGSQVGILDELDMPTADPIPVLARAQAFRQCAFDLALAHGFTEGRADVEMDIRLSRQSFGDQAGGRDPSSIDGNIFRGTMAKFQVIVLQVENRMPLAADVGGHESGRA